MNEFNQKLQVFATSYQKKCTSFRRPDEVMLQLADGAKKLDLSPFEFQMAVAHLVTEKLNKDVSVRPEQLLINLKEALNG